MGTPAKQFDNDMVVVGAGEFVSNEDRKAYGFPESDIVKTEVAAEMDEYDFGTTLEFKESDHITALWRNCVSSWGQTVQGA